MQGTYQDDSEELSVESYLGDLVRLGNLSAFGGGSFSEQPLIPTEEDILKARAVAGTDKTSIFNANDFNLDPLLKKYNKHRYYSKSASIEGSYFKIGPLVYGGEVQDIKILETKAVSATPSTRGGSDFLVDDGSGDADIQVSMVFSGKQHVIDGLVPLIALMKLSPISSVKNKLVEGALYNKFTENAIEKPDHVLIDKLDKVLAASVQLRAHQEILKVLDIKDQTLATEADFLLAQSYNLATIIPIQGKTYTEWLNDLSRANLKYFQQEPLEGLTMEKGNKVSEQLDKTRNPMVKIDYTGHVPVAIVGIDISTHPEFLNTLTVTLSLKRLGVQNFLRDYLQYKTIDNKPTPDARKAFWLNRAMDLYIDKVYSDPEIFLGGSFDLVNLQFAGDNMLLKHFVNGNDLQNLTLAANQINKGVINRTSGTGIGSPHTDIVVTQLSYSMVNKFAFSRLAGESYPTAQHMGYSSGTLTIGIRTNNPAKFEQIHTYKSAADYFVRSADRDDRFSGWKVDCLLTRLFNVKEYPLSLSSKTIANSKLFYPLTSLSATTEFPNTRDVIITLAETSPDFFADFGFVLLTNGITLELLKKFYDSIVSKTNTNLDNYADFIYFGSGSEDEKFSLVNPDTIVAAFLERNIFKPLDGKNSKAFTEKSADSGAKILNYLGESDKYSLQRHSTGSGPSEFIEQVGDAVFNSFSKEYLTDQIATEVFNDNFVLIDPSAILVKSELIHKLRGLGYADERKAIYAYVFQQIHAGTIGFTELFKEHLFSALVNRGKVPLSDRLYERLNVANAYDSLERAIIVRSEELDTEVHADLIKSKAVDNALVYNPDGALSISKRRITAYPDYFYLTYKELFDLPEFPEGYWQQFAYTFQDLGIINPNIKDYSENKTSGLDMYVTSRAQNEFVTTDNSPIAPSVFFYRERELNELRVNMDVEYRNWFDTMTTLRVSIPYDVEFLLTEAGRITGTVGAIPDPDALSPYQARGLASILEAQGSYIKDSAKLSSGVRESAEDAIIAQDKKAKVALGFGQMSDKEFKHTIDKLIKDSPTDPLVARYNKYLAGDNFEAFVPILFTSHANSDVASYKKVSGTIGSIVYKDVLKRAAYIANKSPEEFIGDVLTKNAAGFDDGISLSNSSFDECYNAALKASQGMPDNRNDLIKAFPVFRLYIIDFNKGDRIFVRDNFYGYNAIQSIDITLDKNDADLAVIKVADPMHILQGGTFDDKLVWNKGVIDGLTLPNSPDDEDNENFLARFQLRQGRAIQIRGGYSADPDNLDILFTGRIAEVQFGDIVTIIAQGWKAELLGKQVEFELTSKDNSSVKDLVVRTIRDSNPAGMGQVLSQEELNQLAPLQSKHSLDGAIIRSIQNQFGTFGGDSGNAGFEGWLGLHIFGNRSRQGLDLRLKNIWVPDNDKTRWNPLADIDTTGWEGESWQIPMQPAWDVLQSATNYSWGYICQTVPYDGEATLFFGRPEQLYYYTKGNFKELNEYNKLHLKAEVTFSKGLQDILYDFISSSFYNGGTLLKAIPIDNEFNAAFVTPTINTDYFTMPVSVSHKGRVISFDPDQFSLLSYNIIYQYLGGHIYSENLNTGSKYRRAPRLYDGEFTDVIKKNLGIDFYKDSFVTVSNNLGGDANAAFFLLCSFYGFSENFINTYLYPASQVIVNFLSRQTIESVDSLKRSLLERFPKGELIQKAIDKIKPDFLKGVDVSQQINAIEEMTPQAAGFVKFDASSDSPNQDYRLRFSQTDLKYDKDKIANYFRAIGVYLQASQSLANVFKELDVNSRSLKVIDTFVNEETSTLSIRFNTSETTQANHLAIKKVLSDGSKVKSLRDKALDFFKQTESLNASDTTSIGSIFDPKYVALARKLNVISVLTEDLEDIDNEELIQYVVNNLPMLRAYCRFLAMYLRSIKGSTDGDKKGHIEAISNSNYMKFPPALNMKPFRDYHYIASGVEIVQNNIGASTREMYNTVVIRGPRSITTSNDAWYKWRFLQGDYDSISIDDMEWQTWPSQDEQGHIGWQFNDSLSIDNKKIGVYTDLNIRRRDQAAKVATNVMAKYLRPMYRNNLLLMGRAIKPWDHIHLDDKFTDMWGPLEVERVVHHYSVDTGWKTNIIPHAVVEANPGNSAIQRALLANKIDKIYNLVDNVMWALVILTAIPTLGASVGALGTGLGVGGSTILRSRIAQSVSLLQKQRVQKFATDFARKGMLSEKFKALQTTLGRDYKAIARTFGYTQLASYSTGEMTRMFFMNSMAGTTQAPVTINPLLFKGIPFEAGLNGRETAYWSLTSKLHWTYKDIQQGLQNVGSFITDTLKVPNPSATQSFLEGARKPIR